MSMSIPTVQDSLTARPEDQCPVRQLMLAVEFMRVACEHAYGKTPADDVRLRLAMSVGIRANAQAASLIQDYQRSAFWRDVAATPQRLGV